MVLLTALFAGPETGWHRGLLDVPIALSVFAAVLVLIGTALVLIWRHR